MSLGQKTSVSGGYIPALSFRFLTPIYDAAIAFALPVRRFEEAEDNVGGLIPRLIVEAGFPSVADGPRFNTPFGTVAILRAEKRL